MSEDADAAVERFWAHTVIEARCNHCVRLLGVYLDPGGWETRRCNCDPPRTLPDTPELGTYIARKSNRRRNWGDGAPIKIRV